MEGINMEDYMDVVCGCKFCPYTCTQSPDMSLHVKEEHLPALQPSHVTGSFTALQPSHGTGGFTQGGTDGAQVGRHEPPSTGSSSLALALDAAVSAAVGEHGDIDTVHGDQHGDSQGAAPSPPAHSTQANYRFVNGSSSDTSTNFVNSSSNFSLQVSDDVLSFTPGSQAYMDKGLTSVSFPPLANPVRQSGTLSNTSTPDLSDLMTLVKRGEDASRPVGHITNTQLQTLDSIVKMEPSSTVPPQLQEPMTSDPGVSSSTSDLTPYTVMAISLQGYEHNQNDQGQFMVHSAAPNETVAIPDTAETKEFLLCGLCKLAFTSMEDCQHHMTTEHKELMQGTGVSIGVQVGGAKRGRKKKSELGGMRLNTKTEPFLDPDDLEWLPSVSEGCDRTHLDGRARRRVKPPRALKEDYVLGRRTKKRSSRGGEAQAFKLTCAMMSCKAKFKTDEGLKIHLMCHNLHDSAFTCKECQTPHEFWKHLRMHLWRNHQIDVDLLTCESCNYKTDTQHKLIVHKEIHTDVRPYQCTICNKGFRQSSQMKNHQMIHSNQEAKESGGQWTVSKKCDICDRLFSNNKCLKKHKEAVHSNLKPFQCPYCSHSTSRKAMMQLHLRTHTGEKPFKCDICSYTTGDHNSMRRHKMRHTGQKQYQCTLCPYTCIQSISLKQHMKHKHPGAAGGIFQCSRCPFRTINQTFYNNHIQDHKKGLIPDKIIPAKIADLPKTTRKMTKSHSGSNKTSNMAGNPTVVSVETLLVKHPQFHAVLPGDDPNTLTSISPTHLVNNGGSGGPGEVFNMQVTMLPEGDTQVNADDMARLAECPGLQRAGVSSLQLIYATLATISEQSQATQLGEGRSALLTAELIGGIHTAVLSSVQEGVTVHSITYHLPGGVQAQQVPGVQVEGGKGQAGHLNFQVQGGMQVEGECLAPARINVREARKDGSSQVSGQSKVGKTDTVTYYPAPPGADQDHVVEKTHMITYQVAGDLNGQGSKQNPYIPVDKQNPYIPVDVSNANPGKANNIPFTVSEDIGKASNVSFLSRKMQDLDGNKSNVLSIPYNSMDDSDKSIKSSPEIYVPGMQLPVHMDQSNNKAASQLTYVTVNSSMDGDKSNTITYVHAGFQGAEGEKPGLITSSYQIKGNLLSEVEGRTSSGNLIENKNLGSDKRSDNYLFMTEMAQKSSLGQDKIVRINEDSRTKVSGSSTLREMLVGGDNKVNVLDSQGAEVGFIHMDFMTDGHS